MDEVPPPGLVRIPITMQIRPSAAMAEHLFQGGPGLEDGPDDDGIPNSMRTDFDHADRCEFMPEEVAGWFMPFRPGAVDRLAPAPLTKPDGRSASCGGLKHNLSRSLQPDSWDGPICAAAWRRMTLMTEQEVEAARLRAFLKLIQYAENA